MNNVLRAFSETLSDTDVRVVGVDVFDTLLLRTTLPEREKFKRFSKEKADCIARYGLGRACDADYLHQLRLLAAQTAYRNKRPTFGAREASLDEIYELMLVFLTADKKLSSAKYPEVKKAFREIEIAIEKEDLTANAQLVEVLKTAANAGKKIVAISDMYLSRADLEELLMAHDILGVVEDIYVSSAGGYGKASGKIFDDVLEQYGCGVENMAHIGDSWWCDFKVPSDRGIKAFYMPRSIAWRVIHRLRGVCGF